MFKKCLIIASMIPMMCFGEMIEVGLQRDEFIINVAITAKSQSKTVLGNMEQKDFLLGKNTSEGVRYRLVSCFKSFTDKNFKCTKSTVIQ